jgi:cell division septation protein DedD
VAGAFKMEQNAAKKLDQLRAQGYGDAAIIGQNSFGLHQVVFGAYPQENTARALLDQVKKLGAKDAWLLVQTP